MEKLKINVHPTFIVFACLLIYFGQAFLFFNYLIVILVHEITHAIVARKLGYNIKNIKLIPFGICLNINSTNLMPKDEIKIALAGPLINFFLALITMALWWIFPDTYNYTNLFFYANFITATFNLIPAFPLDGGRVLLAILKQKNSPKMAIKLCKIVNIAVCVVLVVLFVISCFYNLNLTYIFVCLCVLSGVIDTNKYQNYTLINYGYLKKIGKVVKVKSILISQNEPIFYVCKYIDNFSYLQVLVCDENKSVLKTYSESQILELLEKFNASTPFKYVLKAQKTT